MVYKLFEVIPTFTYIREVPSRMPSTASLRQYMLSRAVLFDAPVLTSGPGQNRFRRLKPLENVRWTRRERIAAAMEERDKENVDGALAAREYWASVVRRLRGA